VCARHLTPSDGTPNTTSRVDWPSGAISLPHPKQDPARIHNLSASPRPRVQPSAISLPRPTSSSALERIHRLARARPRPPTTLRIPQSATSPECSARQGTARLTPREDFRLNQAGALISKSAARNLDVITCQDADAPRKQPFAHTPALLQQLWHWRPLPRGLERTDNPLVSTSVLYGKSAGVGQQHSSLSRRLADAKASLLRKQHSVALRTLPFVYK
jgi:hypothetical protein